MDDVVYGNMGRGLWEDPTVSRQKCRSPAPGPCAEGTSGPRQCWGRRTVLVALGLSATAVLCVIILSVLLARVSQSLTSTRKDLKDFRAELSLATGLQNRSCQLCSTWWLPAQGSCYFFSQAQATWAEAQLLCLASGAHLVVVGDPEEQNFLERNNENRTSWLGLRGIRQLGKIQRYLWVDDSQLIFSYWNQGEPNDEKGVEDCVLMLSTNLWNDAPCDKSYSWICEKKPKC
ncbi:C-type lectin domain family 4 member G-like isoform X1 [Erinaceus europaeus]|uniref:C-type lectin domain family 4 member G-like isoform X1 n=1 Tax=Erinaceus europaeus TaxID=9365 RepID=A0ABM3WLB2_ERIEU|nr:C-type lectin domain family 4 member G-like isoform X1 [Erinaceus europaeus]